MRLLNQVVEYTHAKIGLASCMPSGKLVTSNFLNHMQTGLFFLPNFPHKEQNHKQFHQIHSSTARCA